MNKRLVTMGLLICALAASAFGQGSSVFPYTTPLWRTFLDGTTAEFQADSDSTTFFQILDADGGTSIFDVDTTNEIVGIGGTPTTSTKLHVVGSTAGSVAAVIIDASADQPGLTVRSLDSGASGQVIFDVTGDNVADKAFGSAVSGESFARFIFDVTGKMEWGSGAAGRDTNLYRSAANTLKTDDTFVVNNAATIAPDLVVFQPNADSTTFAQVLDAAGTGIVGNFDTTNIRFGVGLANPSTILELAMDNPVLTFNDTAGGAPLDFQLGSTAAGEFNFYDVTGGRNAFSYKANIGLFISTDTGTLPLYVSRVNDDITQTLKIHVDDRSVFFESIQDENIPDYGNMIFLADDDGTADGYFAWQSKSGTEYARILGITGFLGLGGEVAPETLVEMTHATPVITGHASTHSDADESGLFEVTGKREDGAGTETESGHIKMWHDGAGVNDQLTKMTFGTNTGSGVVDAVNIDSDSDVHILAGDLEIIGGTIVFDVNNISADIATFAGDNLYIIDSSGAGITGTLAAGTKTGQSVKFVCKVAGNDIDITVSNHVTSDPEVIRLDTAKEWLELVWDGTDWVETDGNGQTYP